MDQNYNVSHEKSQSHHLLTELSGTKTKSPKNTQKNKEQDNNVRKCWLCFYPISSEELASTTADREGNRQCEVKIITNIW